MMDIEAEREPFQPIPPPIRKQTGERPTGPLARTDFETGQQGGDEHDGQGAGNPNPQGQQTRMAASVGALTAGPRRINS